MKKIKTVAIALLMFGMHHVNAQITSCPYTIFNYQTCDITVHYEVSDCAGVTFYGGDKIIAPGVGFTLPTCNTGWDVAVWLKEMDYVDITNGGSNANTVNTPGGCFGGQSSSSTAVPTSAAATLAASGCGSPTGNYTLVGTGTYTKIGY